jgi:hypothetical protein
MAWRHLPAARSRMLAVAAALIAAFYAAIAVFFAVHVMRQPVGLVVAPLFALLAWGMWKLSRFARWVTIIWMWVLVIAMPLSVFTPRGAEGAYWGALLAAATPFVAAGLFFIYVLGKHKREFKWP